MTEKESVRSSQNNQSPLTRARRLPPADERPEDR